MMDMGDISRFPNIRTQIVDLCKGNPGCLAFLLEFDFPAEEMYLYLLGRLKINGERAYVLWNDCCDRNIYKVKAVLSAWADGGIPAGVIDEHIFNDGLRGRSFDFDATSRLNPWKPEDAKL